VCRRFDSCQGRYKHTCASNVNRLTASAVGSSRMGGAFQQAMKWGWASRNVVRLAAAAEVVKAIRVGHSRYDWLGLERRRHSL
jgi:hypothetical protein